MKKFFAVVALSAFLFACGDSSTTTETTTDTTVAPVETTTPAPTDSLMAPAMDSANVDTTTVQ